MKAALIIGTVALVVNSDFAPNVAHMVSNAVVTDSDGNILDASPTIKFVPDDWVTAPSAGPAFNASSNPTAETPETSTEEDVARTVEEAVPAAGYPRIE